MIDNVIDVIVSEYGEVSGIDDELALKTDWHPKEIGGNRLALNNFVREGEKFFVKPTIFQKSIGAVMGLMGFSSIFIGLFLVPDGMVFLGGTGLLMLGATGYLVYSWGQGLVLDKGSDKYYRGQFSAGEGSQVTIQGPLSDIGAVQIIEEAVEEVNSQMEITGEFYSYEINFVFTNGERLCVMDHGDYNLVLDSAREIAEFLDVDVWNGST